MYIFVFPICPPLFLTFLLGHQQYETAILCIRIYILYTCLCVHDHTYIHICTIYAPPLKERLPETCYWKKKMAFLFILNTQIICTCVCVCMFMHMHTYSIRAEPISRRDLKKTTHWTFNCYIFICTYHVCVRVYACTCSCVYTDIVAQTWPGVAARKLINTFNTFNFKSVNLHTEVFDYI